MCEQYNVDEVTRYVENLPRVGEGEPSFAEACYYPALEPYSIMLVNIFFCVHRTAVRGPGVYAIIDRWQGTRSLASSI